jgi:hypothetical protein
MVGETLTESAAILILLTNTYKLRAKSGIGLGKVPFLTIQAALSQPKYFYNSTTKNDFKNPSR